MTKIIGNRPILERYNMPEVVSAVDQAYKLLGEKKIVVPSRFFTKTKEGGDYLYGGATNLERETFMVRSSAFMPWFKGVEGKRIVTGYYLYSSFRTGDLLAIINGNDIVNLRTGAKSAVAAKYLAKKGSKVLGLIGLGQQARTQAEAIASQFDLARIIGYSRDESKSLPTQKYIKEKTDLKVEYLPKEEVVKQSDILIIGTFSQEPLVSFLDLHPGQLVITLAHAPEVAQDVIEQADQVFVDYLPTSQTEAGSVKAALDAGTSPDKVKGDLTELASDQKPGRQNDHEIIYFQSQGVTHEDFALVEYLYDRLADSSPKISLE